MSHITFVTFALALAPVLRTATLAQEVASLDLTAIEARTDLRLPKATSTAKVARGSIFSYHPCYESNRYAGALRTTLVSLDSTHYEVGDEPKFEVTVENVGTAPIKIPFSPHLADLQPKDAAHKFTYNELRLELWIAAGEDWRASTGGSVALYGSDDHIGTMLTLKPGESVRIIGMGYLALPPNRTEVPGDINSVDHIEAVATLHRGEILLTATAEATVDREICLDLVKGQSVHINLIEPKE
ncbi:MAG TPA: hypothetical protein VLK33_01595 [Terriglobales bacterium]|nr:hypothetical protein [Terriglobales bacterium]